MLKNNSPTLLRPFFLLCALVWFTTACKSPQHQMKYKTPNENLNFEVRLNSNSSYQIETVWHTKTHSHSEDPFGRDQKRTAFYEMFLNEKSSLTHRDDDIIIRLDSMWILDQSGKVMLVEKDLSGRSDKIMKGSVVNNQILISEVALKPNSSQILSYDDQDTSHLRWKSKHLDWNLQRDYPSGQMAIGDTFRYVTPKSNTGMPMFDDVLRHSEKSYILKDVKNGAAYFDIITMGYDSITDMMTRYTGKGKAIYDLSLDHYKLHEIIEEKNVKIYEKDAKPIFEETVTKRQTSIKLTRRYR